MTGDMEFTGFTFLVQNGRNITVLENTTLYSVDNHKGREQKSNNKEALSIDSKLMDTIYILDEFGVPVILIIGLLTNILLSVTIRKSELMKISTYSYFFTMGIVDSVYLVAMFIPWISTRSINIYNKEGFCQLVYYLNVLTVFLSNWYFTMLLFERVLTSYKPEKAKYICSAFRTKCYITVVAVFAVVGHLYLTWTSGVFLIRSVKHCTVIPEHAHDIVILRKVDIVFSFILPFLATLTFISCLVIYIITYYLPCKDRQFTFTTDQLTFEVRIRSSNIQNNSVENSVVNERAHIYTPNVSRKQLLREIQQSVRLTVVSLIIAVIYVALSIPHSFIKSRITFMAADYQVTLRERLYLILFEEIYKFNFSYKGIIYLSLLPEMRQNMMNLFKCRQIVRGKSSRQSNVTRV